MTGKPPSLRKLDKLFGPLQIGEIAVSRRELQALGGKFNGEAISAANTYFSEPGQDFIDGLSFDPVKVEHRIKTASTQDSELITTLLYEIATHRSVDSAPLMRQLPAGAAAVEINKVAGLLNSIQRIDIHRSPLSDHLPSWVDKTKSRAMTGMGVGMQAYGFYSAYVGAVDALKKGELGEVAINVGGAVAEIGSLTLEYSLSKAGEKMIRNGMTTFQQFGKTTTGLRLSRGAGLIASALTLPFDLYTAITAFNDAAKAQGKAAQDLYVTGGLSVFSASLSLMLGGAALLGFKAAGPIGIAAAAIMIVGAKIYAAARQVDDIDDYIELSVHERWRAGWFAFTGQSQDQELMDRFTIAKTWSDYAKALESKSIGWLNKELKESVEAVVNGRFEVTMQPTRIYKYRWDEALGESSFTTTNMPAILEVDDDYDATQGLPSGDTRVINGQAGADKGVLWQLGGGNDTVKGLKTKPNFFNYGAGKKGLTGGEKDDTFVFQTASETLETTPSGDRVSALRGGDGNDLLWLQGKHSRKDHGANVPPYLGYDIDLNLGKMSLRPADQTAEPVLHTRLESIEKVETLAGAKNRVTGSDRNEVIAANGEDVIDAGAGDDHVLTRGSHVIVNGGSGADAYTLDPMSNFVSITEDGQEQSTVYLGVPLESIQSWRLTGDALVIESLRDDHPQTAQRRLAIESVYESRDGERSLHNDKWLFITTDGYHLQPDWPQANATFTDQPVNLIVVKPGNAKASPALLNGQPENIPKGLNSFYYVSRATRQATVVARPEAKVCRTTLYLDFDSAEIAEVRFIYVVESTVQGAFKVLGYDRSHFTLTFKGGGMVSLHGGMSEDTSKKTNRGAGILAGPWAINHEFILVMRDGVSYRLDYPANNYADDAAHSGYRSIQSPTSLRERAGKYLFVKPSREKRVLKRTPQRIDFEVAAHNAMYWLEGRSATYEIYPASNTRIELSTAAEDAERSGSSTWNIHLGHLTERISHADLSLSDNLLKIGSIHVQLPDSNDPLLPLETVTVVLASGDRYEVDALFELITPVDAPTEF
ncbi:calcium-binding protein [Pseudomonas syringae]|nr:calcium-binding protein [Pseudomonas syringae]MCF5069774.1 calcium-binding protein [Pseudomonas syringae]